MRIFEYVVAALLLIIGLGITQLLNDAVQTFRLRHKIQLHWIPLVWAGLVFLWQMQFIWASFELDLLIKSWTAFKFAMLLFMALLLFVSGALIVPKTSDDQGGDAWEQFLDDGRWALVALASFFFLAFFSNPLLFNVPLWIPGNVLEFFMGLFLILVQFSTNEKIWKWATVAYTIVSLVAIGLLSPVEYQ
ncbi:hypothetical protein [Hydrogenimonas sp.]|uniref:hypothetical protein n=1 Tax=Hydrogenimonas sp. TaxID=2231112 RepID=UPI0026282842|nr:hypothetical protein [Hydrogenimonas sp.]